ncbi:MAG: extradiol ring-cleavage dioxygenase [Hyphomicrobiaceae bacterium]
MAQLALAIGSSHSPMLASPPEDYPRHAEIDAKGRKLIDKEGRPCTYGDLLAAADPGIAGQISIEVLEAKAERCNQAIARLSETIAAANLNALIVIGDDQHEQYFEDNMPSILVYWGDTVVNRELSMPEDAPKFWRQARSQYHEAAGSREYPVDSKFALHLIEHLVGSEFDVSHSRKLAREHGEGHAFGFVHRRLMGGKVTPIVPVALNTYFPPNQPLPRRCYGLGQQIRKAVEKFPSDGRYGILASGGLSHFTVDEDLDRGFIDACKRKDASWLSSIPPARLNSGNSEMRNWITVAGAAEDLQLGWHDYVPCYRSPAGTGCGMGFAIWQ